MTFQTTFQSALNYAMCSLTGYSNFNTEKSSICRYEIPFVNVNILCTLVSYLFAGDINYALKQQVSVLIDIVCLRRSSIVSRLQLVGIVNLNYLSAFSLLQDSQTHGRQTDPVLSGHQEPSSWRTPFLEESVDEMLIKLAKLRMGLRFRRRRTGVRMPQNRTEIRINTAQNNIRKPH